MEVRYGKIGATGQTQLKPFDDAAAALKSAEKLVAEKLKGGYLEVPSEAKPTEQATSTDSQIAEVVKPAMGAPAAPQAPPGDARAKSRTLCISGKLPSGLRKIDYQTALQAVGIEQVDEVIMGLSYLVTADPTSTSIKVEKARRMGVQILSEDQLIAITSGKLSG